VVIEEIDQIQQVEEDFIFKCYLATFAMCPCGCQSREAVLFQFGP